MADHFRDIVQKAGPRLLVFDFYADWCQPCRLLSPILEKLADKYKDRVSFYKVDVDRNKELANGAGMQGIPYVLFVKDGAMVHSLTGLHPKDTYARTIERFAQPVSAEASGDTPDGEIVNGVREIRRSTSAALDSIYVYRGDTVKLIFDDVNFPYGVHIPEFSISEESTGPVLEVTFKAKNIGVFPIFCNGNCPVGDGTQFGQIVVMQFEASEDAKYEEFSAGQAKEFIRTNTPLVLDVRTPGEYYGGHLKDAKLIPVQQLEARLNEIQEYKDRDVFLYCRSGNRSTVAADILIRNGFTKLYNLRRGIVEWGQKGYEIVK